MLNDLLARVSLDYALFMDECLQELFPAGCDPKQFIKDHEIHIRIHDLLGLRELWMDDKRVGTFSQRFEGTTYTFEFTK